MDPITSFFDRLDAPLVPTEVETPITPEGGTVEDAVLEKALLVASNPRAVLELLEVSPDPGDGEKR